ncbi:MAG TPA: helix-turn-helix transcriptional regulator [Rhizomicrobium sp.]|nr:helix-turn-helix transcriptional regulator [Rhizomicrobium sp.]
MTREALAALRGRLGWTQAQMADAIGLTLRAYSSVENGHAELRQLHALAAERVALSEAAARGEPSLAPASVRRDAAAISSQDWVAPRG